MLITEKFANFVYNTNYDNLPQDVIGEAKARILDTVGAGIAGCSNWEYTDSFLQACRELDKGEHGVWGNSKKEFSLARACAINATFAHAIELDDGHKNAGVHAGAVVIPTALKVGASVGATGKEIITAIVIGYEIVYRIATAVSPKQIQKGFHPSGNNCVFGAMAVAGKLMNLNKEQLANGLGFAGLFAAGLMEATQSGQGTKCVQVGAAAANGIVAAYLGKNNLEGCRTVVEGKNGIFNAQSENVDVEKVCEQLGLVYTITDTYSKLYPTCRHSQPAIEAVLDTIEVSNLDYTKVDEVIVGTHQVAYDLTGTIYEPKNVGEAKFSLPYGVALALREKCVGVAHLNDRYMLDEEILALARKVKVYVDSDVQSNFPARRGAQVKIIMNNGEAYTRDCYDLKGSPNNPVGLAELKGKFIASAKGFVADKNIEIAIEYILNIENKNDIKDFEQLFY